MRLQQNPVGKARALFLAAAFASFVFSVALFFTGSENQGIFVGLWVPSIIGIGTFLAPRELAAPQPAARPGSSTLAGGER